MVVVPDQRRANLLARRTFKVQVGDFTSEDLFKQISTEEMKKVEVIFIATTDYRIVERTLETLNKVKSELEISPIVFTLVPDELLEKGAKDKGADGVLPVAQSLAKQVIPKLEDLERRKKEKTMRELICRKRGRMLIITQNNPDPDGIASAAALKRYAQAFGIEADIACAGEISGYYENKVMKNILEIELLDLKKVNFERYFTIALVDVSTRTNCSLPEKVFPTIVIDHHSVPSSEVEGRFKDIEPTGATSTLLANYLWYAGIEIDPPLATALALGIITDTMHFTRGVTPLDFEVFQRLRENADLDLLRRLQIPLVSKEAFDSLANAIKKGKLVEGCFVTNIGRIENPDVVPQVADLLLQREGIVTSFVYGLCGDAVRMSARTKDKSLHLGQLLRDLFPNFAGGHASMAAGMVPLSRLTKSRRSERSVRSVVDRKVARRFLEMMGLAPKKRRKRAKR